MKNIIINKKTRCRDKDKGLQRLYIIDSRLKKTLFKEHSKFKYNIDFDTKTVKIVSNNANIGISSNHKLFTGRGTVSFKEINKEIVPVVDINNKKIREVFGEVNECGVVVYNDEIVITPSKKEKSSLVTNIKNKVSNVIDIFSRKKKCHELVINKSYFDVYMQKASGMDLFASQISMFDMGFTLSEDAETQNNFSEISKSEDLMRDLSYAVVGSSMLKGFTYFELFAGSGTGGLAFDNHGCTNVGYSEIDKFAIKNYEANFPGRINWGDITTIDEKMLPKFDFLIFGSPCQNVSLMRRKYYDDEILGIHGEESRLFFDSVRILNYCKPKWFIFENVRDLLYQNEGKDWETVKQELSANYNIQFKVLNTADYGVPQTRRRIYVVGQLKSLGDFNFTFPNEVPLKYTAFDFLEKKVDDKYYITEKFLYGTVMATGTKNFHAHPELNMKIARPLTKSMHKKHRASQDNYYETSYAPEGKTNVRFITPTEARRLQGLPEHYKFVVSDSRAYMLMGNAMSYNVVNALVEKLAFYIKRTFGLGVMPELI